MKKYSWFFITVLFMGFCGFTHTIVLLIQGDTENAKTVFHSVSVFFMVATVIRLCL